MCKKSIAHFEPNEGHTDCCLCLGQKAPRSRFVQLKVLSAKSGLPDLETSSSPCPGVKTACAVLIRKNHQDVPVPAADRPVQDGQDSAMQRAIFFWFLCLFWIRILQKLPSKGSSVLPLPPSALPSSAFLYCGLVWSRDSYNYIKILTGLGVIAARRAANLSRQHLAWVSCARADSGSLLSGSFVGFAGKGTVGTVVSGLQLRFPFPVQLLRNGRCLLS